MIKPSFVVRACAAGALGLSLCISGLLIDQNVSFRPTSRRDFHERLDSAIQIGTAWTLSHPERANAVLVYMIADMAALSHNEDLARIVARFRASRFTNSNDVFMRLVDPTASVWIPSRSQLDQLDDYQRWFAYTVAPKEVVLTEDELSALFASDRYMWGSRTHQLFALLLYRERVEDSPRIRALIHHLCEKIAIEADADIRVTDLYAQRLAFVLAAGRPDLIRRRWVERLMGGQLNSGGWVAAWYGWGPRLFEFTTHRLVPNSHTTVQAMWALYMLKYRYPEWIDQHFSHN